MDDKVITTFVTEITWYCCSDKLPANESEVLFRTKNGLIYRGEFWIYENNEQRFFPTSLPSYAIADVEWWAEIPLF